MRARVVVFPLRELRHDKRQWCFARSINQSVVEAESAHTPSTIRELWKKISSSSSKSNSKESSAEVLVDFVSNKMNRAWTGLEQAPPGSFKNKLHGLGMRLMSRVPPSEIFLKSIPKEVTELEVLFPSRLNPRLVRRRLRHMALSGIAIHKRLLYGSVSLLPVTSVFTVLPLPNVPFFWVLFRSYSHWRALKGSERLLQLVSSHLGTSNSSIVENDNKSTHDTPENGIKDPVGLSLVLKPSEELDYLVQYGGDPYTLTGCSILKICKFYHLNKTDVLKFHDSLTAL